MELDDADRIGHRPNRKGNALSTIIYTIFGLAFLALASVALLGGTTAAVKGTLVSLGLLKREDFSALYRRLGVPPLAVETEAGIADTLDRLGQEHCDPHAMREIADAVTKVHDDRWAADALLGWSKDCAPDNAVQLRRAASLYIDLHDYTRAAQIASDLINAHPAVADYWYLKGKADVGLHATDAALLDYANTIHLAPRPTSVGQWVFSEMSDIYAAAGRFCEAIGPVQDYMSLDLSKRATPQMQQIIDTYAGRGHCAAYAAGTESFPVGNPDVIRTRATIDGVTGTFAVDTGASFVTVTKSFAAKAHLGADSTGSIRAITANGAIYATLASAETIKVGRVEAKQVPVAIQEASLGDLDGLLGRSFLSRFDLTIAATRWTLRPKAVSAAAR